MRCRESGLWISNKTEDNDFEICDEIGEFEEAIEEIEIELSKEFGDNDGEQILDSFLEKWNL